MPGGNVYSSYAPGVGGSHPEAVKMEFQTLVTLSITHAQAELWGLQLPFLGPMNNRIRQTNSKNGIAVQVQLKKALSWHFTAVLFLDECHIFPPLTLVEQSVERHSVKGRRRSKFCDHFFCFFEAGSPWFLVTLRPLAGVLESRRNRAGTPISLLLDESSLPVSAKNYSCQCNVGCIYDMWQHHRTRRAKCHTSHIQRQYIDTMVTTFFSKNNAI